MLEEVLRVINEQNLLENVRKTGEKLKRGLLQLEKELPGVLHAVRGRGVFLAVSVPSHSVRDDILNRLKQNGIQYKQTYDIQGFNNYYDYRRSVWRLR